MQVSWLSIFLFGVLGLQLDLAGVGVVDKPVEFLLILATVLAIEFRASMTRTM